VLHCSGEISIPGHEDDFIVAELERGGEVNRVVAAQPKLFGMPAGTVGQVLVDANWLKKGKARDFVVRRGPECETLSGPEMTVYMRVTGERGGWRASSRGGEHRR
jgi:hypothetical protein